MTGTYEEEIIYFLIYLNTFIDILSKYGFFCFFIKKIGTSLAYEDTRENVKY